MNTNRLFLTALFFALFATPAGCARVETDSATATNPTSKPTTRWPRQVAAPQGSIARGQKLSSRGTPARKAARASRATTDASIPSKYRAFATAFDLERMQLGATGAAVALIEHGEITFTHGFGTTGLTSTASVDESTIFRIGSSTEAITAAAQLALVGQGKVALSDNAESLIPGISLTDPSTAKLTLRQLLSHESGLFDFINQGGDPLLATNSCATDPGSLGAFVTGSAFAHAELFMTSPGSVYTYSSPDAVLAGAALEHETGAYFADAVKQTLFAPLGMKRSFFVPSDVIAAGNYANGLAYDATGTLVDVPPNAYDCAAYRPYEFASTSVSDYAKFVQLLLRGDSRVLRDKERLAMQSKQATTGDTGGLGGEGYGLTVQSGYVSPKNVYYPTKTVFSQGFVSGYSGEFYFFPETGFGVVVLASVDGGLFVDSLDVAVQSFAGLPDAAPLPDRLGSRPAEFSKYVGTYLDTSGVYGHLVVSETDGALTMSLPDTVGSGFVYYPQLSPVLHRTFLSVLGGYFAPLTFLDDASGATNYVLVADTVSFARVAGSP